MNTILKTITTIITGALLTLTLGTSNTTSYADQVKATVNKIQVKQVITESTQDFYLEEGERAVINQDNSYTILNNNNEIVNTSQDEVKEIQEILTESTEYFYLEAGDVAYIYTDGTYDIYNNGVIVGTEADTSDTIYTEDLLNNEQLQQYAEQFLLNNFNIELNIPVHFANLEEDIQGRFYYGLESLTPNKIEINTNIITEDSHVIERVLIHELLHYALNIQGKEFNDGDETFENELVKFGSTSNDAGNVGMLVSKLSTKCCD